MCGIAGIFERDPAVSASLRMLERMTMLLAHRGPDDSGHLVRGNVALGHRRLSVIDLSAGGHQPMGNEDGSIWIVYNGECYNYRELARHLSGAGVALRTASDTEVLLKLYERQGESFLERVEGMFALALWDERRQTLLLARDRLGIKPLYYHGNGTRFVFASELKALLADPQLPARVDMAALGDYFHFLSIPDPRTILSGVFKLPAGHYLKVCGQTQSLHQYWDVRPAPVETMGFDDACDQFYQQFKRAVRSHLVADVPVGAFLSGGVDSSAILAMASMEAAEPIESFSATFPLFAEFDEGPVASEVAARCNSRHHEFPLTPDLTAALPRIAWHADEPFAVSSAFALYFLAELARKRVKVVLSGDGADEVFGGYVWRHADWPPLTALYRSRALHRLSNLLRVEPLRARLPARFRARLQALSGRDDRYVRSVSCMAKDDLRDLLTPACQTEILATWESNAVQRYLDAAKGGEQLAAKLYADIKTTLVSEMLTKVDRMTMAHGLEARVPFLDHRLVEWAFTVPGRHKVRRKEGKALVKRAMERHLPKHVLYRPKHGFNVPFKPWLRKELKDFARDTLSESRIAARGLFEPRHVTMMLEAHYRGQVDASNSIFSLLMLELWMQKFLDAREEYCA